MNKIIKFENHPNIGEYIFSHFDLQSLLNCQFVCKDWKEFLENPYFWLKKLKDVGQPIEIENAWKNLIAKSTDFGVAKSDYAECLQKKFKDYTLAQAKTGLAKKGSIYYLNCPPIYTAAKYGHLDIVKLIHQLGVDFNRKIYWVPNLHFVEDYYDMPIFAALQNGHVEVVKFLAYLPQELQNPSADVNGSSLIVRAMVRRNLEMVKMLMPLTPDLNCSSPFNGNKLIHLAISDYKIFQYMMSQPGIDPNSVNAELETPLQVLCYQPLIKTWKISPEDVIKMIKVLAPLADPKHACDSFEGPIQRAVRHGQVEVLKILLLNNFDVNVRNNYDNHLPIETAILMKNVEAIKILAPLTNLEV